MEERASTESGAREAREATATYEMDRGYNDTNDGELNLDTLEKKQLALNALQACLEAEGLTGAVTVKQDPKWQCCHCKQQFPILQMLDLQQHEAMCAKRTAMLAADGTTLPMISQTFLQRTMLRFDRDDPIQRDDLYRSTFQEMSREDTPLLANYEKKMLDHMSLMHNCCSIQ
mmetsp:Transcript_22592/g.27265  ORF Transcript_22592/g.27265 Transcript_22592/m.27265 type:complete len:173 (-) Transcript_22592:333-851(-)